MRTLSFISSFRYLGHFGYLGLHRTNHTKTKNIAIMEVASLIEQSLYEPSTANQLESYVDQQISTRTYDFAANKALLKNYQVNTSLLKIDSVTKVLLLSLMQLPKNDFHALTLMLPPKVGNDARVKVIKTCASLLAQGKFGDFWEEFIAAPEGLFAQVPAFVDYVRFYIVGSLCNSYRTLATTTFVQQLGINEDSIAAFCNGNQFIERVESSTIVFAANVENRALTRGTEEARSTQGLKIISLLSSN